jgi:hypothetical protein
VTEWHPFFETRWHDSAYNKLLNESKYNYVACPNCFFSDTIVKIRLCDTDCKRECYKDF